jgi:acetoin utilization deacetylase AcuC-like enzyme
VHGVNKVAIIDWDVHHGNGTQDIFYEDESVFYFSTHQSPWYPGTGAKDETGTGKGLGTVLNAPFSAGSGMVEIGGAFKDDFLPAMEKFKPELVIISAGFDSRKGDPLGHFQLGDEHFVELTELLLEMARKHANGNLVSVLEGGYNVDGLAKAVSAHLGALAG